MNFVILNYMCHDQGRNMNLCKFLSKFLNTNSKQISFQTVFDKNLVPISCQTTGPLKDNTKICQRDNTFNNASEITKNR